MKHTKILLALLLSVVMLFSLIPVAATAAEKNSDAAKDLQIIRSDPSLLDWNGSNVVYIDFSQTGTDIPLSGTVAGHGLSVLTNESTGSTRASNRAQDGYMILGKDARTNDNPADMVAKPTVAGALYVKLDAAKPDKAKTPYAVKVEYYGGGIGVDGGSYIDLCYNTPKSINTKTRNKFGATYNSGKVETMYFTLPDSDLVENNGGCKADFRFETWTGAQLQIRKISVITYVPLNIPPTTEISGVKKEPISQIDFSNLTDTSTVLNGSIKSDETLSVLTNIASGTQRASNRISDGYMLFGKAARLNTLVTPNTGANQGRIYVKLSETLANKANKAYAIKVDYLDKVETQTVADTDHGIIADSNSISATSWISIVYTDKTNLNTKETSHSKVGYAYNSGAVKSMYFLLPDANFSEKVDDNGQNKGADFKLNTDAANTQLKIKGISVVAYDTTQTVTDNATLFQRGDDEEIPEDTALINVNTGKYHGIQYTTGTPVVKLIDLEDNEHFVAQSVDYLNFKISDPIVKAAQKVTLSISYWDIGTKNFSVEYNSQIPNPLPPNTAESYYNYYTAASFEMYDSKTLMTIDIPITNAAFNGKQTGGNDFRIRTMYIPDFYVEKVVVKVGVEDVTLREPVEFAEANDMNNFADKTVVGYQAWFQASDSQTSGWNHWNSGSAPAGGKQTFDVYPDVTDYPDNILHQTGYADLLNGKPAVLYDGTSEEAIDVQVKWMQDYGIDGFAVSRFYSGTSAVKIKGRTKLDYMKEAAEKYGRLFYMGYDMSGIGGNGEAGIKRLESDFVLNVEEKYVGSPNYAQIDGKPVVSLWGFQGSQFNRYPTTENSLALINWFHDRGYYVIGGAPDNNWAKDTTDYSAVYEAIDMITPWTVGRYNNTNAKDYLEQKFQQDREWLDAFNAKNPTNIKSYMPNIYPGFSWANWASGAPNAVPRGAGQFMWDQAKLAHKYGFTSSFIAMFDEYDEGTPIAKMAEDSMSIPRDQYFVTAAADGKWLSSDFYLRATAAVSKMLRGEIEATDKLPIPYSTGPVFWRDGFERRFVNYKSSSGATVTTLANLDVCVPNGRILTNNGINDITTIDIANDPYGDGFTTTGEYAFNLNGVASPVDGKSQLYFNIADTNVEIQEGMVLSYNLRPETKLGSYVFVDLLLDNGQKLSDIYGGAVKAHRGTTGVWTPVTFSLSSSLVGRTIDSVIIAYDNNESGEFNAYIDDVVIEYADVTADVLNKEISNASALIVGDLENNFTAESVSALKAMILKAQVVLANTHATESQIKDIYFSLLNTINSMVAVEKKAPVAPVVSDLKEEPVIVPTDTTSSVLSSSSTNESTISTSSEQGSKPTVEIKTDTPVKPIQSKSTGIPWLLITIAGAITALALAGIVLLSMLKRQKETPPVE